MCPGAEAFPLSAQCPQIGSVAVLALQVSCTALYLHSAMSMCFQLGLTSIRLITLAGLVFMLLLLEGEFSSLSPRPSEERWAFLSCPDLSPSHNRSSHSRKYCLVPSFLSPSLHLWLLLEVLTLLTLVLLPLRNVECLNLLLSSGADLRRRDKFGRCVDVQAYTWELSG